MTGTLQVSYYSRRGTVYYTPTNSIDERSRPATLHIPPCQPRRQRPLSIRITRLPAGFVPFDLRPLPPSPEAKKPSRFRLDLRKLASRENAKRVLGSVFSPFSLSSSTAASSAVSSTRSISPETTRSVTPVYAAASNPITIYSRRSVAGSGLDSFTMSGPPLVENAQGAAGRNSISAGTGRNSIGAVGKSAASSIAHESEKPVASGNGVSCSIILAEPNLFLVGLDHDGTTRDSASSSTAILRGKLQLNVTKSAKIKAVTLKFMGKARTEWPEGIPPSKTETFEEESLRTQVLPFFNAMYEDSDAGYGISCNYVLRNTSASSSVTNLSSTALDRPASPTQQPTFSLPMIANRSSRLNALLPAKEIKRLSLQSNQSRSFQKGDSPFGPSPRQKGYKVFHPGVYEYSFELPLDNSSPESTKLQLASVRWELEAFVERAGTFRANLRGPKEVSVIRSPSEDSLETVEPISISRKWEDQLHYDIIISGKSFPLGSKIPIAFKLTPLAKVQVHKIKVFVTENIEYFTNNRKVTRKDATRKLCLLEKCAGKPLAKEYSASEVKILTGGELSEEERARARDSAVRHRQREAKMTGTVPEPLPELSENLLGDIELGLEGYWGQTEIEANVQLPTCEMMAEDKALRLSHDSTWKNVSIHHWIKIVLRISRAATEVPTDKNRRHFEISIDSPFTILNCRATQANTSLPEYSDLNACVQSQQHVCGCPNAAATNVSPASTGSAPTLDIMNASGALPAGPENVMPTLARPPQAHFSTSATAGVQRPIHMLRNPSFNPPAFDAEQPPPLLATPPPQYDHIIGTPSHDGLADYFTRMAIEYEDDDHTDDEGLNRVTSRGRVNVANPRTPGGRVARSMDIDRNFMFNTQGFNDRGD